MEVGKWYIELFDGKLPKYGGHWSCLSSVTGLDYLAIGFCFGFGYSSLWYDGQHHALSLGLINICWGGPYWTDEK